MHSVVQTLVQMRLQMLMLTHRAGAQPEIRINVLEHNLKPKPEEERAMIVVDGKMTMDGTAPSPPSPAPHTPPPSSSSVLPSFSLSVGALRKVVRSWCPGASDGPVSRHRRVHGTHSRLGSGPSSAALSCLSFFFFFFFLSFFFALIPVAPSCL